MAVPPPSCYNNPRKEMSPTEQNEALFSAKLRELKRQQEKTAARLCLLQKADHARIRRELEQLRREELEEERLLRSRADTCRSPAVKALSRAQLEYLRRVRSILREELPDCLHSQGTCPLEDRAEAACLYGEYALDAAAQATRHALLAALQAMDLRMRCQEQDARASHHDQEELK